MTVGNAKRDAVAHETVKADLKNELRNSVADVNKSVELAPDVDNALQRAQNGDHLTPKDIGLIESGTASAPDGANAAYLARTLRVAQLAHNTGIRDEGLSARSAQEALSWTLDMAFLFTLEAILTAAIKGQLPKGDDDDDSWLKFLAKQTGLGVMGTLPFIRDGASSLQGFSGGGAYGSAIDETGRGIISLGKVAASPFFETELKRSDAKAIIGATGLATGLPATQFNRVVDAWGRSNDGEDVSLWEYVMGRMVKH